MFQQCLHCVSWRLTRLGAWSSAAVMRPGDDFLDQLANHVGRETDAVTALVDLRTFLARRIGARGVAAGLYTEGHAQRLTLQCSAAVQGIAALMTSRRITLAHSDALIDDAIALHLAGASTAKWRSFADDHPWQLWPTGGRT